MRQRLRECKMKISEKIKMSRADLEREGAITIVAFGDSVTHGALGAGEINYETVYWNRLRGKILEKRSYVPVNVINSGIGGVSAKGSLARFESQALKYEPDLLIICFGLNDVNGELEDYLAALREMFSLSKERGIDTVFLTPNMMNTYVAADTHPQHLSTQRRWQTCRTAAEWTNSYTARRLLPSRWASPFATAIQYGRSSARQRTRRSFSRTE